ncbi:hypothetical protein WSM22_42170 [Cytophagales bacterium WSM2-2]|nr:hypothetical protein WSM22_42170 [Cytophagales bacterium WSM2-2]
MISKLNIADIKLRNLVVQHIIIIGLGVLLIYIEELELASMFWEKVGLIIVSLGKSVYFIEHSFRKVEEASLNNISYNHFLLIILVNILLIVVSFSADYMCMLSIDETSFRGINNSSLLDAIFDAFYFSIVSFTTVAYGDIVPVSKAAKLLTLLEVIIAYLTTIIIISNFVQIKDSLGKK